MGKKSRSRKEREELAVSWYQWEFLRRNPKYRQDYERFLEEVGDWLREKGFWYEGVSYDDEDVKFFRGEIFPRMQELGRKWQVMDLYPPDWRFERSGGYRRKPRCRGFVPTGSASGVASFWGIHKDRKESREKDKRVGVPPDNDRYLQVRVDVTRRLEDTFDEMRRIIQFRRRRYKGKMSQLKGGQRKARRRIDLYEKYLEVWDLRQEKLTFEQIARRVYPREYEAQRERSRRFNPILQRVRDHYSRAKQLIEGGYKELG